MSFFACVSCESAPKEMIQKKYAKQLVNEYVRDMELKYQLKNTSMAWGMYGGILDLIGPGFATYEKIDIPTARRLILELSGELIKRVNESEELRPYLKNYPFTVQNVKILLGYNGDEPIAENELEHALAKNGIIYYKNIDKQANRFRTVFKETYEQALQENNARLLKTTESKSDQIGLENSTNQEALADTLADHKNAK